MDNTPNADIPVTFDMLLEALDGAGQAFGIALRTALAEFGATPEQHIRIARRLHSLESDSSWTGPDGHTFGGIVAGFLKP